MVKKVITRIKHPVLIAGIVLCLVGIVQAATGNIDPTDKWAWGTDVGWINFRPEHGGVTVYGDHLEGYAWGENIGWIRLGSHEGGGAHTYGNSSATDYGVNRDASGNLSGYAWGSNVGWINFNPTHSQVTIDPATGSFDGYAWGENIGWIHFKNASPAYNVVTNFTRKTLTVTKAGTGDGTVTSNPAGINCGAHCSEAYDQDTVVTLTANADGDSDFAGWSGDCSGANSTTTVTMDADKTCTATFNLKPGSIKVCKDVVPDDASLWDFTLSGPTPGTKDDLGDSQCHTWSDRTSGDYTLSEATQAGYDTSVDCGAKGSDNDHNITFTLNPGDDVTCTFTNVKQGTISIVKDAAPDDSQDFHFSGDLGNFSLDDDSDPTLPNTATFQNQGPGTYSVSEVSIPVGWNLSSIVCNDPDGGTTTDLGTATANIDLDAGEGIVCTFTNTKHGTISIVKDAAPDDPQDFDFSGDLGNFSLDDDSDPTLPNTATFQNQAPGTYSVSEVSIPAGWNLPSIVCNDPDGGTTTDLGTATANIDLDAGEGIVCTFTNIKHGTIVVEKQTSPDGAVGSFTFSGDAAGTISDDGTIVVGNLQPGIYTATEADPGPGFDLTAITCDDGNSSGDVGTRTATFNLEGDETVKCTFTNTQQRGTIIVEKHTNPDGSWGSFTFSGHATGTISDNGQIVVSDLLPGTYTATEADPSPEFELTAITCDDGNSSGDVGTRMASFNLEADETVKCTFTNAQRSLQVSKELELPVGGLAAVDQIVRFNITIENNGGLTIDPLTLRDDYDSWCLRSRRAEVPPDVHGGMAGFLQWNNLGALPPGQTTSLWVEFTAAHGCEEATNRATVETGGLTFEDETSLRILETIARVGGFVFHDDNGNGVLNLPCRGTDVDPATCEPGLEQATAETTLPSGELYQYDTNTSGWYSFNLLDPGTYHVDAAPPGGSWWTPTTAEECDATVVNNWDQVFCHFGYWWGLDGPPMQAAGVAGNQVTLLPTQDATISDWNGANEGHNEHLRVRQPGVTSALLQFDLSGLPEGAEVVWAKLRLYSPFASNTTNRLYMTAYPLDKTWVEEQVTWLQAATGMPWDAAGATGDHGDSVGWAWIDAPGWVEFDLNSDLLTNDYGFLLRGEGSENREVAYWFFSREYLNADVRPQLVVGYDVP